MSASKIRVAIIGGGLAGSILMNALSKHSNLDVNVYESSAQFNERGASVGLSGNASRALEFMDLKSVLPKAGAVRVNGMRLMMGEGPDAGKKVMDVVDDLHTVHRAALLRELLAPIEKSRLHVNKRLSSIDGTSIHFEDGTSTTADAIIGADGIHGPVRSFILGKDHPELDPIFAGFWDCRHVMPVEKALEKIGKEKIDLSAPRQHLYCGDKSMLFHDIIDDGKTVCVVAGGPTPADWEKKSWKQSVTSAWLYDYFKNWGSFGKAMIDLLVEDREELSTFVQWESGKAPTFYRDQICMIGDAAHATTPWQGAGLGQCIEDILVLQALLGKCQRPEEVKKAFKVYDAERRERSQRVVRSSKWTGQMYLGSNGLDVEKLYLDFEPRWDFIFSFDAAGAVAKAVSAFEATA